MTVSYLLIAFVLFLFLQEMLLGALALLGVLAVVCVLIYIFLYGT